MGVTLLLDTHVLLWLLTAPERVPESVRALLADRANPLLVSAASALEIGTKIRIGKLAAPTLPSTLPRRINDLGATSLAITVEHALLAGSLRWDHRDPFDRILVAQATIEDATLVTVDSALIDLPFPCMLSW
ncbi:MAG TPA: type II toxin-antitoxin system VapC family toxin [Propionibacteriaceae bacterium]